MLPIERLNETSDSTTEKEMTDKEYDAWLKDKFHQQHQDLMPKVAVADMFYSCNKERKSDPIGYRLKDLITKMPKDQLAMKLSDCLATDGMKSDVALNFGLHGCFSDQFSNLPAEEKKLKMILVTTAINSLTRIEREQGFAKCVNHQSISYLK